MIIAPDVNLIGLRPETMPLMLAAEAAYAEHGEEARMTSGVRESKRLGGRRRTKSLHPVGLAIDWGLAHVPRVKWRPIFWSLKKRLESRLVDVVFEPDVPGGPHIHTEVDP